MSFPFEKKPSVVLTKKAILIKALEADERKRVPKMPFVYPFAAKQYGRWANR